MRKNNQSHNETTFSNFCDYAAHRILVTETKYINVYKRLHEKQFFFVITIVYLESVWPVKRTVYS